MVGAICTDTLCIIVINVSGYLAQINFKSSEVYLSCNRKTHWHMSISVPVYWLVTVGTRVFKGRLGQSQTGSGSGWQAKPESRDRDRRSWTAVCRSAKRRAAAVSTGPQASSGLACSESEATPSHESVIFGITSESVFITVLA